MKSLRVILAALIVAGLVAPAVLQEKPQGTLTAVICGKLYTGKGEVFAPGVLVFDRGRVISASKGDAAPDGAKVIDARTQVVIPGLVNANASVIDTRDAQETVSPEVRAIDGLDMFKDVHRAIEGGVTTLYVTPGSGRLVAGQGAVVKTAGARADARVLKASFGMKVSMGERPKNPPAIFEPPIPPSSDNPILPPKRQYPVTRMGELAMLRKVLTEAQHKKGNPHPESTTRAGFLDPLREVIKGERPLVVQAGKADDIVKAVLLAEEFHLSIIVTGGQEADRIAPFLAQHKVSVVWDPGVFVLGDRKFNRASGALEGASTMAGAAAMEKAGVSFALQSPSDGEMAHLLLQAAWAVRNGVSPERALRAVTADAAAMLGVDDRVGSLEKDRDADFVVLSGDPFNPATRVDRVFVGGEDVHAFKPVDVEQRIAEFRRAPRVEGLVVVKAGRLLTGFSSPAGKSMIFIENGKLSYVGPDIAVPSGATIVDASNRVVGPGLVNIGGWIGLGPRVTEQTLMARRGPSDNPISNLDFAVVSALNESDPAYREALASGVTTVLVAPSGQGVCSLVKITGGAPRVMREWAALRFNVEAGKGAYNSLKKRLEAAKKYHEDWEAFEKAQKEGKKDAEAPKTKSAETKEDPISGTWEGAASVPSFGVSVAGTATMKLEGTSVTGTISSPEAGNQTFPFTGTFVNNELTIPINEQGATGSATLKLERPDVFKGGFSVSVQGMTVNGTVEGRRTSKDAAAPVGEKKEMKKDDRLEPYRALFRREIPALVRATSIPAIENALKIFRDDFNLNFTLLDPTDAYGEANGVLAKADGVAWTGAFLGLHRNEPINSADLFMRRNLPVAFFAPGEGETPLLPMVAGAAVHYGCDPTEALRALTTGPARMLMLERTLGSVSYGRDADLVIYSGDPFDWTSRVETVLVDGKVVYERGK